MIEFICTALAIGAAAFTYVTWHHIPLTVVVFIAAVAILRTIKPIVERPWKRKHPPVKVDVLRESHTDNPISSGVHFLIMTQEVYFNCKAKADFDYLNELCDECVEKLLKENENFKWRYNYVEAKKYPIQYAYCGCGASDFSVSTHYLKWVQSFGVTNLDGYRNDVDIFTIDDTITLPSDGTVHRIMFQAVFDKGLPSPEK